MKYSSHPWFPCSFLSFIIVTSGIQICHQKIQILVLFFKKLNLFIPSGASPGGYQTWKIRTRIRIWILRRQIWIPEVIRIKNIPWVCGIHCLNIFQVHCVLFRTTYLYYYIRRIRVLFRLENLFDLHIIVRFKLSRSFLLFSFQ